MFFDGEVILKLLNDPDFVGVSQDTQWREILAARDELCARSYQEGRDDIVVALSGPSKLRMWVQNAFMRFVS